jgi:hypothetical protein
VATTYHPDLHANIETIVDSLLSDLGLDINVAHSPGFRLTLEVMPDGQSLSVTLTPSDKGQRNAFNDEGERGNPIILRGDDL